MTAPQPEHSGPGRPRGFDLDAAIEAGVAMFRAKGFEATSLDALTEAMGISRSSFYAAFGSKHGVLVAALERYSDARIAALESIAGGPDPIPGMMRALPGADAGAHGCLMVNCIAELCPRDAKVAALSARHLERIEAIFARALGRDGFGHDGFGTDAQDTVAPRARALIALALGVLTLRKAGQPPPGIDAVLDLATPLIATPN